MAFTLWRDGCFHDGPLKELEEENRRLKKMYAEERLKAEIIQEAMAKSGEAIVSKAVGARSYQKTKC